MPITIVSERQEAEKRKKKLKRTVRGKDLEEALDDKLLYWVEYLNMEFYNKLIEPRLNRLSDDISCAFDTRGLEGEMQKLREEVKKLSEQAMVLSCPHCRQQKQPTQPQSRTHQ